MIFFYHDILLMQKKMNHTHLLLGTFFRIYFKIFKKIIYIIMSNFMQRFQDICNFPKKKL
jgi:hypothetical protein